MDNEQPTRTDTRPLLLVATWLVVLVPALWGVSQTAITSKKLFQSSPPAAASPATAPAVTPSQSPGAAGNTLPEASSAPSAATVPSADSTPTTMPVRP